MVIEWDQDEKSKLPLIRAAEYVRMSTEHQKYSTDNQSRAIRTYADQRGYEIVKTYADEGKSGLNLDGRKALQQLLNDVESGIADFEALIVYDVSRWGRFQDPMKRRRMNYAAGTAASQSTTVPNSSKMTAASDHLSSRRLSARWLASIVASCPLKCLPVRRI